MNLDERWADLRSALDEEISRARRSLFEELSQYAANLRFAENEAARDSAIFEARKRFTNDPAALEFVDTLAALVAGPAHKGSVDETLLKAQRFARVRVAEIQLYHSRAVKAGRAAGDLYRALRPQMDSARETYREKFLTPLNGTADYLHAEFVKILANDDATLLGSGYPGPLV